MFDAEAVNQPVTEPEKNSGRSDPYEGLRSPISLEERARAQGVKPIKTIDDLPKWPEDDLDAWDGFDEFLEELRHGNRPRREWMQGTKIDER